MGALSFDVDDKADPAAVFFESRVVKALFLRKRVLGHFSFLSFSMKN
jgi:hypothetical protein